MWKKFSSRLLRENEKVGPDVRGTRPLIIAFVTSQQRDEVLRKVSWKLKFATIVPFWFWRVEWRFNYINGGLKLHLTKAKLLKKLGIYVEEDLTKGTKEKRGELRKYARQVIISNMLYMMYVKKQIMWTRWRRITPRRSAICCTTNSTLEMAQCLFSMRHLVRLSRSEMSWGGLFVQKIITSAKNWMLNFPECVIPKRF